MRSKTYYRVRTAVRILFWSALAVGTYYLATHINWVGDHYCFGTIDQCYLGGK
jgi:hypothetical protein